MFVNLQGKLKIGINDASLGSDHVRLPRKGTKGTWGTQTPERSQNKIFSYRASIVDMLDWFLFDKGEDLPRFVKQLRSIGRALINDGPALKPRFLQYTRLLLNLFQNKLEEQ